ncbi:MAG: hypothetical protein HYZ75_06585 [Elusimicrobia bacterium]|nr:hypothetical protein [Elusimicrobiota bacterium]
MRRGLSIVFSAALAAEGAVPAFAQTVAGRTVGVVVVPTAPVGGAAAASGATAPTLAPVLPGAGLTSPVLPTPAAPAASALTVLSAQAQASAAPAIPFVAAGAFPTPTAEAPPAPGKTVRGAARASAPLRALAAGGPKASAPRLGLFFDGSGPRNAAKEADAPVSAAAPTRGESVFEAIARFRAGEKDLGVARQAGLTTSSVYQLRDHPRVFVKHAQGWLKWAWALRRYTLARIASRLGSRTVVVDGVEMIEIAGTPGKPGPIVPYKFVDGSTQLTMTADTKGVTHAETRRLRSELNALGILWMDARPANVGYLLDADGNKRPAVIDMDLLFDLRSRGLGGLLRAYVWTRDNVLLDAAYWFQQAQSEVSLFLIGKREKKPAPEPSAAERKVLEAIVRVRAGETGLAVMRQAGLSTSSVYQLREHPGVFVKHAQWWMAPAWALRRLGLRLIARRLGSAPVIVDGVEMTAIGGAPGRPGPIAPYKFLGSSTQLTMTADTKGADHADTRAVRDELNAQGIIWMDARPSNIGYLKDAEGGRRPVVIDMDLLFDFGSFGLGRLVRAFAWARKNIFFDANYWLLQGYAAVGLRLIGKADKGGPG